jgi:hypothetical protein
MANDNYEMEEDDIEEIEEEESEDERPSTHAWSGMNLREQIKGKSSINHILLRVLLIP